MVWDFGKRHKVEEKEEEEIFMKLLNGLVING